MDIGFILGNLWSAGYYLLSFIFVISLIVFIHEYGHYIVAKLCKVKIETFSLGFGKELFGFRDKSGTNWKISLIPAGGYVKMFGDSNEASKADQEQLLAMSEEEKRSTFYFKKLYQKALIVVAGPIANFLLGVVIFSFLYGFYGKPYVPPVITHVVESGAAEEAGLEIGDKIISIDGEDVETFDDIVRIVSINPETEIFLTYERDSAVSSARLIPKIIESNDVFGNPVKSNQIGIAADIVEYRYLPPHVAVYHSIIEVKKIIKTTCKVLWQMVRGERSLDDLGGPIRIIKYSGQSMGKGIVFMLWFIAMLSINVGFVNLLPIPVLDGGHLFYYMIEALCNRKFALKYQDYSMKAGIVIILMILALTTFNDVKMLFL